MTQAKSLETFVLFRNSHGLEGRGTLLHLTRHSLVLEVYNPYSIVQLSEVLLDLKILRHDRPIYHGRAVVTTLVPTGALTIVSATLVDPWSDLYGIAAADEIRAETERFIQNWEQGYSLRPQYQLAVSNLASFLQELDRWLGQAEALYASDPGDANVAPNHLFDEVWPPVERKLQDLFESFEAEARQTAPEEAPIHMAFARRELHPLLMCDPFIHRSFTKPLGYAGDYQVVNMILGGPDHCSSTYARIISTFNLSRSPAVAHRNRIRKLEELLRQEARSTAALGKRLRVLNIGCGPAVEVERFVAHDEASTGCEITLVDFNKETLEYADSRIARAREKSGRALSVSTAHQSIHDLLKAAASGEWKLASQYDFIYCAGLFDYLPDRVCRRLVRLYHQWTAPGGLVVVTNVHRANPIRAYMAHLADWHVEHRDERQFLDLSSNQMAGRVSTDPTGVNIFLEIRKPRN